MKRIVASTSVKDYIETLENKENYKDYDGVDYYDFLTDDEKELLKEYPEGNNSGYSPHTTNIGIVYFIKDADCIIYDPFITDEEGIKRIVASTSVTPENLVDSNTVTNKNINLINTPDIVRVVTVQNNKFIPDAQIKIGSDYYIRINADYIYYYNNEEKEEKIEVNSNNYFKVPVPTNEITIAKIGYYYKPYHALYKLNNNKIERFSKGEYSMHGKIYEVKAADLKNGLWEVR